MLAFRAVPGGFIPTQDKQYLFAVALLPEGASLDRTDKVIRRMGEIALETDGIEDAVQFPGLNALHFINTPNIGTIFFSARSAAASASSTAAEIAARSKWASARSRKASRSR